MMLQVESTNPVGPAISASFFVSADTSFGEIELPDGKYSMVFELWDAMGNYAYTDAVDFDCADGEIYTTVYEDY